MGICTGSPSFRLGYYITRNGSDHGLGVYPQSIVHVCREAKWTHPSLR